MYKTFFVVLAITLTPASSLAATAPATFSAGRSVLVASSSPANAYAVGATVVMTAPVVGDLTALGGSVIAAAPVLGDALLGGGSISLRSPVSGDLRAMGGSIKVLGPVTGDLTLIGFSVEDAGRSSGSVFIIAANTTVSNGAAGPVTIYGNNVALAGDFVGDVTVTASGHLALAPNTVIRGSFSYEAPEEATIPSSVTILGTTKYTHVSYLPSSDTSHMLELMSIGFFIFVRIVGAIILAGLLAGLFPRLAEAVTARIYTGRMRSVLLTMLLGFAVLVATPILILLLMLTFIGIGVALLTLVTYFLVVLLSLAYAGIVVGSIFMRRFRRRETVLWHDGVLGMLVLSFATLIPIVGPLVLLILAIFCTGALLLIFFHYAFTHEDNTPELL